MLWNNS